MRMESITKKSAVIWLISIGLIVVLSESLSAQWGWNPFSSGTQTSSKAPAQSSFFNSPFDYFGNEQTGSTQSVAEPSARPISELTRRRIVEESRQYPTKARQTFIKSFAGLNDQQAQDHLRRSIEARSVASRPNSAFDGVHNPSARDTSSSPQATTHSYASNPLDSQAETQGRKLAQTTTTQWTRPASQSSVAMTDEATFGAISDSAVADGGSVPQERKRTTLDQARMQETRSLSEWSQAPDRTRPAGPFPPVQKVSSKTPQLSSASSISSPQRRPISKETVRLPIIRPAGSPVDTSHYRLSYQPANAPSGSASSPTSFTPKSSTNQSLRQATSQGIAGPELSLLISRAEALAAASTPGPSEEALQQHISRHVDLRLLYLLAGERDKALIAIPGIESNEQIFWTRTFWALQNYLDHPSYPHKSDRTTVALEQLRKAIQAVQGDAHLAIRNAALCSDIESFGNYTRFPRTEFVSGQEILVYSELDNFTSERTVDGKYRTVLKSSLHLFAAGPQGGLVDQIDYNATEDLCHTHRSDFMQGYRYRLPEPLSPGAYVLQLTIEDQVSGNSATYSLNFLVR